MNKKYIPFKEIRFMQASPSSTLIWGLNAIAVAYETNSHDEGETS